jgi:hypothetical protein
MTPPKKASLVDLKGIVLFSEKLTTDNISIPLSDLPPGLYIISLNGDNVRATKKVMKI